MWFSSWLRNGKHSSPTARRRTPTSPRQRASFRPRLEALEDRCVPSTLTVTNTSFDSKGSLRYEIAAAHSGDTIDFNFGKQVTGVPTINTFLTTKSGIGYDGTELYIDKNLTIEDTSGSVIINGGGLSRVFEVAAGAQVKLSGLEIWNGGTYNISTTALQYGGGILNHGVLTVIDCGFLHNQATYGGGLYNDGTLTVSGSGFSDNFASEDQSSDGSFGSFGAGGGIYNAGTATVSGCTFSGNSAWDYGTDIANAGTLTVSNSTFGDYSLYAISGGYTDGGGNTFS